MPFRRALIALALCGFLVAAPPAKTKPPQGRKDTALKPPQAGKETTIVKRWLHGMTLRDEVAQLLIMPCYGEAINSRSRVFRQYMHQVQDLHVGGVIVIGQSTRAGIRNAEPYAMAALLNRLQKLAPIPLLVAADFERGASMRVNSATSWPYNMAFTAARDVNASRYEGAATAREARTLGVNWIFAPVADVNNNPDNPIINIRSYGENADDVAAYVAAYIQGAHSNPKDPVLVTAKHFPGHGDTSQDSHLALARISASRERMNAVELLPFRTAIANGVDAIMTAHMAVPALDPQDIPATVSTNVLTGLLRNELKFNGLIVTDAMDMAGLTDMFNNREAAVRALEAGADVLLMPRRAEDAIDGVVAAVQSGRLTQQRVEQSLAKVLAAKARLGLAATREVDLNAIGDVVASPEDDEVAQRVADRAVTLVKDERDLLPLRNSDTAAFVVLAENRRGTQGLNLVDEVHKRAPKMKTVILDPAMPKEDLDQITQSLAGVSSIVVAAYVSVAAYRGDVALAGNYPDFLNNLLSGTVPVTLAALGNPYLIRSFPAAKAYLTTYSTTQTSEASLVKALFGEMDITGRLPVTIPGIAKYGDGIQHPASNPRKGL